LAAWLLTAISLTWYCCLGLGTAEFAHPESKNAKTGIIHAVAVLFIALSVFGLFIWWLATLVHLLPGKL
jgi:arginine exporter protein ArgO